MPLNEENYKNVIGETKVVVLKEEEETLLFYGKETYQRCKNMYNKAKSFLEENYDIRIKEFEYKNGGPNSTSEFLLGAVKYVFNEIDFEQVSGKLFINKDVVIAIFASLLFLDRYKKIHR